jgi:hypothetical protein
MEMSFLEQHYDQRIEDLMTLLSTGKRMLTQDEAVKVATEWNKQYNLTTFPQTGLISPIPVNSLPSIIRELFQINKAPLPTFPPNWYIITSVKGHTSFASGLAKPIESISKAIITKVPVLSQVYAIGQKLVDQSNANQAPVQYNLPTDSNVQIIAAKVPKFKINLLNTIYNYFHP